MSEVILSDAQKALVDKITGLVKSAQESVHNKFAGRCEKWDDYYHSWRSMKNTVSGLDRPDRDMFWQEQKSTWGSDLHVPYAFSVVETMLPRMLANNPRMLILPRERVAEESVENMKFIIDAQQEQMNYPMSLQTSGKDGLLYGLAVSKLYWRTERKIARALAPGYGYDLVERATSVKAWDDPDRVAIDPRDFIWDQMATSSRDMRYAVHRTWRDTGYILKQVQSGAWPEIPDLTAEQLKGTASKEAYNKRFQHQAEVTGISGFDVRTNDVHEVWEFHGFGQVCIVVDKKWPLFIGDNPYWHGELPFHIFRPTEVTHNLVGYSVVESIKDLSDEMNELRRSRRDNVRIVLQKPFLFQEGMFDPDDLQLGPGLGIAAAGDLNDALRPIEFGDIPFSGFREEDNLRADIERTTGISASVSGGEDPSGAAQTATGIQLTHAATNERIKNMTMRIEGEMVTPEARQMLALNQQYIIASREVRVPTPPDPNKPDQPERRYTWRDVGPRELMGGMDIQAIGGSTAAENVPQERQDGQLLFQMFANNQEINQRKLALAVLEKFGVKDAAAYMAPPQQMVPAESLNQVGNALLQAGVPPQTIQQAIDGALAQAQGQQPDANGAPGGGAPAPQVAANG